jgi:2,3-dimethylmalate lyase
MDRRKELRRMLADDKVYVVPGVYDCVSSRIVEELGFEVAFISGYCLVASVLGYPDIGLASKTDVVTHARNIARSVRIPVICDADTGYGNALNVWEAVREFESTGIAGIEIEDQLAPKKCGYLTGRSLVSKGEMQGKIEAAVAGRGDPNFLIVGRTDARGVLGLTEAIERSNAYLEAGADMIVLAEHYEVGELRKAVSSIRGAVGVAGAIPGRAETLLSLAEYRDMGVKMIIFGLSALYAAARGVMDVYGVLRKEGHLSEDLIRTKMLEFEQFNELMMLSRWDAIERKYLKP